MTVETIGQALDLGWRLEMRCARPSRVGTVKVGRCEYRCTLDVETLACTRGRAFPLAQIAARLKCPRCGCIDVRVLFTPGRAPARGAAAG